MEIKNQPLVRLLDFLELASVSWVRRPSGSTCATPVVRLPTVGRSRLFVRAVPVAGRRATVNRERAVALDERLAIVKDRLRDVMLSTIPWSSRVVFVRRAN